MKRPAKRPAAKSKHVLKRPAKHRTDDLTEESSGILTKDASLDNFRDAVTAALCHRVAGRRFELKFSLRDQSQIRDRFWCRSCAPSSCTYRGVATYDWMKRRYVIRSTPVTRWEFTGLNNMFNSHVFSQLE